MRCRTILAGLIIATCIPIGALWFIGSRPPSGPRVDYPAELERITREAQGADADAPNGWEALERAVALSHGTIAALVRRELEADEDLLLSGQEPERWCKDAYFLYDRRYDAAPRDVRLREAFWASFDTTGVVEALAEARAYPVFVRGWDDRTVVTMAREWVDPDATTPYIDRVGPIREIAMVLAEAALRSAEAGEWDTALARIDDGFFVSRAMTAQVSPVDFLVGIALRSRMCSACIQILATVDDAPESFLAGIESVLVSAGPVDVGPVIDGQRLELLECSEAMYEFMRHHFVGSVRLALWSVVGERATHRSTIEAGAARARSMMGLALRDAEAQKAIWDAEFDESSSGWGELVEWQMHTLGGIVASSKRLPREATVVEIVVALRRFQMAHGRLPDTLDELVPECLATAPVDPYAPDGQFRYISGPTMAEVVLYSVGRDGVDHGGERGESRFEGKRFVSEPGDDVFVGPSAWAIVPNRW